MKSKLFFILSILVILMYCSPDKHQEKETDRERVPVVTGYNEELAQELSADKYGMKTYVFAFLKAGPNRSQDSTTAAQLQAAHLKNIQRMADKGKLVLAGPFMDSGEIRGIYIFDVPTLEEARQLTETDPAIQAGRLAMELRPWYGSAALVKLNQIHESIAKEKF
ncbi:hypothetical protein GF337_13050 [candidate division KSB1 bacterium]|nr:hypothetical protein [candidate division KSB1 bacterium]